MTYCLVIVREQQDEAITAHSSKLCLRCVSDDETTNVTGQRETSTDKSILKQFLPLIRKLFFKI